MKITRYDEKVMDRLEQKIDKARIKIHNKSDDRQASDSVIDRNTSELLNFALIILTAQLVKLQLK